MKAGGLPLTLALSPRAGREGVLKLFASISLSLRAVGEEARRRRVSLLPACGEKALIGG